jgi:hypothetical protein
MIFVAGRMSGSSSRSAFAVSLATGPVSILAGCGTLPTNKEAGAATLTAIETPNVTRQKTAIHIVLVMLDPKPDTTAPALRRSMGTNHRDRIRAARWPANVRLQHRRTGVDRIGLRHRSPGSNRPLVKPPACRIVLRPISARSTSRSTTGSRLPRRCIPAGRSAGANRPYSPR